MTNLRLSYLASALLLSSVLTAHAAELKPGDQINASNLAQRLDDTFEGTRIGDMLTERMQTLIREEGLKINLKASEPITLGKDYMAATRANAGKATFNPNTRQVEGWVAGMPFPDVQENDPHAAEKLIWNHHYAQPIKNVMDYPKFAYLFIDPKAGLERKQDWRLLRYQMKGRLGVENPVEGDGSIFTKTLLYATYPSDIRGLGLFTIRYDSPKLEDSWAYVKSVRRTRRLSGGTWMDPIGGTDQLNDDVEIFNAHPSWYPEYKLLGKRKLLVVANSTATPWDAKAKGNAEFPIVDLDNAPHWNPKDGWEPRDVWVIEAITPPEHPYSRKVLYMDTQFPRFYQAEVYDRKGQFWKWMNYHLKTIKLADGDTGIASAAGFTIDYQGRHGTVFILGEGATQNTPGITADDVNLRELEKIAH
ncbi:DUF1329 domain-containing protein [Pseudomonas aeruginosa]|uniref:DUF1329 domain-containing protein n=1 Tax=Pseudomonas aeruginosa TaxID=287 RepID=UPI000AA7D68D|nr:DUF1329 domain-containing protein [Pseudomonas aeruginosa]